MVSIFSRILWLLYKLLTWIWPKAKEFQKTRQLGYQNMMDFARQVKGPYVWLHGSSAGELDQALALAREIRRRNPQLKIAISVFSLSVKNLQRPEADVMFYCPLDFPWTWKEALFEFKPIAFASMTWDIFPNLLKQLNKQKIPTFLASAALALSSWRLRFPMSLLLRSTYNRLTGIGCADEESVQAFQKIITDSNRVKFTKDSRIDSIAYKLKHANLSRDDEKTLKGISGPTIILASTYSECDLVLFPAIHSLLQEFPSWRVLIFPHFIDENRLREVEQHAIENSLEVTRFSAPSLKQSKIVLVDKMGILANAYRHCEFVYVGGAFHHRIHNVAECVALGKPVVTGPRIQSSPFAKLLHDERLLPIIHDAHDFYDIAKEFITNPKKRKSAGDVSRRFFEKELGGSALFYDEFLTNHDGFAK